MSTYTSEPGTRLAGRYRLVDQVNEGAGWTYWKATDETLARSVTVLTFATGFPRVAEAITAARAASRLNDPRFPQVFDVEDADELPYVVMEWVVGESLLDMLAEGPLDPPRAAALVLEAAQAITAAQAAGLSHLRLNPACLHWTPGGGVKIAGLGIDAALAGPALTGAGLTDPEPADPELSDRRGPGPHRHPRSGPAALRRSDRILARPAEYGRVRAGAATARAGDRRDPVHPAPGIGRRPGRHRRGDLPGAVPAAEQARTGAEHAGDVRRRPGERGPAGPDGVPAHLGQPDDGYRLRA